MKNKLLCFLLTGTLLAGIVGGAVQATEFTDGTIEQNEMLQNTVETENNEDIEDIEGIINIEDIEIIEDTEIIEDADYMKVTEENMEKEIFEFSVFSDGNAALLNAGDMESEKLIEAVESGEMIAVTPASFDEILSSEMVTVASMDTALIAEIPDVTYKLISGPAQYCDEVWTYENSTYPSKDNGASYTDSRYRAATTYRTIQYVDADGKTRNSPLYCLEASKSGINPGANGEELRNEAISLISNTTIKKILYFGYGGPGDICDKYDPTCSHIDWSQVRNRFIFTHYLLSKVYFNDVGHATESEIAHVGLNTFLTYIKSLTIPNRKAIKLSASDIDGNISTSKSLSVDLSLYRNLPDNPPGGLDSAFDKGYQITPPIQVLDEGGVENGLKLTSSEDDEWQILFWKTEEEYTTSRGPSKPRVLVKGKNTTISSGGYFQIVFPENMDTQKTFKFEMSLYPVSFLLVSGDIQKDSSGYQDFGAYVYQDTRGTVKLTVNPAPMGQIRVIKTNEYDGAALENAVFTLTAAQDLYSGVELIYEKGDKIANGTTDEEGKYTFKNLIPGKYTLKEKEAPEGFLLDTSKHSVKVTDGNRTDLKIINIPDLKGHVYIEKLVENTNLHLNDAQFTIYEWSEKDGDYSGSAAMMSYDETQKLYVSQELVYDADNKGKFKVVETKNPPGYSGSWSTEFRLNHEEQLQEFQYKVENSPLTRKVVEIQKKCADTGVVLKDAVFTIYEFDSTAGLFKSEGKNLSYDSNIMKYVSEELAVTDENNGKYLIKETKAPDGYQGDWEQVIDLLDSTQLYQFSVSNDPVEYPSGEIYITKRDSITGEFLSGAEFMIYAWDTAAGTYLENPFDCVMMVYDEEVKQYCSGNLELNPQNEGKFKVVETKNPEGYVGTWEKEVLLTEEASELTFEVENEPENLPLGTITVVKKIKESEITWAHGNPVFHFAAEGIDLQGKYHKYENYVRFSKNSYSVDENGYAVISYVFSKIPIGTYEVYEKPVMRYYLKEAYGNTSNVSIVLGNTYGYGSNPKDVAYGIARLDETMKNAAITFVNQKQRYDDYSHNAVVKNVMPAGGLCAAGI